MGLPLMRMPPSSRLMAPPLRTAHRISAIIARPYPLYPPSGIGQPSIAAAVSVVGTPFGAMAHPGGIVGSPLMDALKILPIATVVVAMSSSHRSGPGSDTHMGLVPKRFSRPCHGATRGEALHITIPSSPAADMR